MKRLFCMIMLPVLLTGCGDGQSSLSGNGDKLENYQVSNTEAEGKSDDGNFIYRIVSEKALYEKQDPVNVYAELEYIGDLDQVTIYHAASPFYFPLHEKTRDLTVGYGMEQPLLHTTLVKGEPLREKYKGSGGYGAEDDQEFIEFVQQITENQFPTGYYKMNGYADFYTGTSEAREKEYHISAEIEFKVQQQ